MPWKASSPMDLRAELMRRLAAGERMSALCREYGISRKTGHKFQRRFEEQGRKGLENQSRAPKVVARRTPPELTELILAERRAHPTWGGRLIKSVLEKRLEHTLPSAVAIHRMLQRAGLIAARRARTIPPPRAAPQREATASNDLWCIDYKGQFRLGDRSYCYPLTLTDQWSRFVLACEGMAAISDEDARDVCIDLFRTKGLPIAIRSDNGPPFASTGLGGLTKLSAFWLQLGIALDRSRPSHPEDNGRHERMHRTLKAETTRPARANLLQQQECFDAWRPEFNEVRPHQALGMKRPADVYVASPRPYPQRLPELRYPTHDDAVIVGSGGSIPVVGVGRVHVTRALVGQTVGLREAPDGRWLVTFATLDLGHIDRRRRAIVPISQETP